VTRSPSLAEAYADSLRFQQTLRSGGFTQGLIQGALGAGVAMLGRRR
jgi:hypothetical protein